MAALLVELKTDGLGILLVEHDMDFVMASPTGSSFSTTDKCSPRAPPSKYRRRARPRSLSRGRRMRGSGAPLLVARDLTVAYGKVRAVRDVSLEIFAGEVVTIVGANGAGKTTLLMALMGLLPFSG